MLKIMGYSTKHSVLFCILHFWPNVVGYNKLNTVPSIRTHAIHCRIDKKLQPFFAMTLLHLSYQQMAVIKCFSAEIAAVLCHHSSSQPCLTLFSLASQQIHLTVDQQPIQMFYCLKTFNVNCATITAFSLEESLVLFVFIII